MNPSTANGKGLSAANAEAPNEISTSLYFKQSDADRKAFATLAAKFALLGHTLARAEDGSYVVARWTFFKALADLEAVKGFLHQIGGGL